MRIVKKGDPDYPKARRIANARFHYDPAEIWYCENDGDVRQALDRTPFRVRVRSGGHHHEGMCSADGVRIVDLSAIDEISPLVGSDIVSIGPGAKLCRVYETMRATNRLFPGGGCGDVHVGGLVQGGGWGPYSRKLGLTCDSLVGVHMITADGTVVDATPDNDPHRLLWAMRGAGGGNFGIVTRFDFRLPHYSGDISQFSVGWQDPKFIEPVVEEWAAAFPNAKEAGLTSFCRVTTVGSDDLPVVVNGFFLGDPIALSWLVADLLKKTFPQHTGAAVFSPFNVVCAPPPSELPPSAEYQPGPPPAALRALPQFADAAPASLQNTCDGGFYAHKVSSTFPKRFGPDEVRKIAEYVRNSAALDGARRYLSLHSLGGAVGNRELRAGSCFPWGEKPLMLQCQAWWIDPKLEAPCLQWISGFRQAMTGWTEGAFINFPDSNVGLEEYYSTNYDTLKKIKKHYDPNDFFKFPMGIPPAT